MILVFRIVLLLILALLWLIFGLIVCVCRPGHRGNIYWLTQMLRCARWAIGIKVDSQIDVKAIREEMPAVFVGNHQYNWDIIVMADIPRPGIACIGKKSLMWTPIFGLLFYLSGNIFIDRSKSSKGGNEILKIAEIIKTKKKSIWIFPEGHRSKGKGIQPFMNGAVNIANQSGVKILPFAISSYKIDLNRWDNGTVTIKSLPPVTVDNLDRKGVKMVTRQLRQDMKDCIDNMDKANGFIREYDKQSGNQGTAGSGSEEKNENAGTVSEDNK